jgi:hypothetical protein
MRSAKNPSLSARFFGTNNLTPFTCSNWWQMGKNSGTFSVLFGLETGSAAQDYMGLYGGDADLLSESLEYIQGTLTQILNAIGAVDSSAPPA